jgi:hypothetical protein
LTVDLEAHLKAAGLRVLLFGTLVDLERTLATR